MSTPRDEELEKHLDSLGLGEYGKRFIHSANSVDPMMSITLTGHLVIEEVITDGIEQHLFHPDELESANFTFAHKVALGRSMSLTEQSNPIWDLVLALNALRNDYAHALESPKREKKLNTVLQLYRRQMDPEFYEGQRRAQKEQGWPDYMWLTYATALCLGFLGAFVAEAKRFREFVDAGNYIMNPHLFVKKEP